MATIFMAMSGCGKTRFCLDNSSSWKDLDSGALNTSSVEAIIRIFCIIHNILKQNIFLDVSSIWVDANIIPYYIVLPEKQIKNEIIDRIKARDNDQKWASEYVAKYDELYELAESVKAPKIYLKSGQYISDVINIDGSIKDGVEIIQPEE